MEKIDSLSSTDSLLGANKYNGERYMLGKEDQESRLSGRVALFRVVSLSKKEDEDLLEFDIQGSKK